MKKTVTFVCCVAVQTNGLQCFQIVTRHLNFSIAVMIHNFLSVKLRIALEFIVTNALLF